MTSPQFTRRTCRPRDAVEQPAYTPELARELRAAAGLSQSAMAAAVGYTAAQNWSAVERGERAPSRSAWLLALIVAGRHSEFVRRA